MAAMFKKLLSVFAVAALTFAGCVLAQELREDHPDTYVVQKGDTLWDISARFLKQPWLWPEIWQANPQIENPHLIYPGDVISLAYLNGRPRLTVDGERSAEIRRGTSEAIPTIPLSDVEAFLRSRRVLDEEPRDLPYVLAIEENRLRGASGQVVYVRGANFEPGQRWAIARPSVMFAKVTHPVIGSPRRIGEAWNRDKGTQFHSTKNAWAYYVMPEKHFDTLGWEMADIATGQITVAGDPATLLIDDEGIEIKQGDVLMPILSPAYDLHFIPHAPQAVPEDMRVLAVTDYHRVGGPRDVVALSAGAREGVENGQVYSLWGEGEHVRDDIAHRTRFGAEDNKVKLPDEFAGHVMIFRTFDKVSYGLVMDGVRPIRTENIAKAPVELP